MSSFMVRISLQLDYQRGVSTKIEVIRLNDSKNISTKVSPNSTLVVKPCGFNSTQPQYYKMSTELQSLSFSNQSLKEDHHIDSVVRSNTQVVRFDPSRTAVVKYQPEEDILSVCLEQGSKRTLPPPLKKTSSYFAELEAPEPPQQPVLVIVSKHEFDSILKNKKQFFAKSEALLPVQDKPMYNCKMDICVYDLELDNHLLDQLSNLERSPHVFVTWSFLGLQQRTVLMPATDAQFCTTVTYFGPVTEPMVQQVKERELVLQLMLEQSGGHEVVVGEGLLDLMPALDQPDRGFVRCVPLHCNLGGHANVYVSFIMHECCETDEPPRVPTGLEVGIGSLRLNSKDVPPTPDKTHLYVEYTLLGFCGPELETESMPRSDVVRFNHTKRLSVNDSNSSKLDPLLTPGDTQSLRFNIIAEPCNLDNATDVQAIGHADVNLLTDIIYKNEDMISKQVPVYNKDGLILGNLSVTIIGISTLQNRHQSLKQAL